MAFAFGDRPALKKFFAKDFYIGAALSHDQITGQEAAAIALVEEHFNSITAENILKWVAVHPEPDRYDFGPADQFVAFGEKHGMFIVGHTLVWHQQTPAWFFRSPGGGPPSRELALARLRHLKGREEGKPISVLVSGPEMIERLCRSVSPLARRLMAAHWPGPLTLVLPARKELPRALLADFGGPVTATSANRAGEPPVTTAEAVEEIFDGRCLVIHGGATTGGAPSTVARVRGGKVEILRSGALRIEVD